jgi:ubiquinone/menaquinone biosynthesis C-methylase UbiE/pimeloyl-ACP methyl ester carboxylesterase
MASVTGSMASGSLRRLHRGEIKDTAAVLHLFERLRETRTLLHSGMDHRNNQRTASVQSVAFEWVQLSARHIDPRRFPQIYFSFDLVEKSYFFVAEPLAGSRPDAFAIRLPTSIYEAERRCVPRLPTDGSAAPHRIEIHGEEGWSCIADVVDSSYSGIAVAVPSEHARDFESPVRVRFLDGPRAGEAAFAFLRHRSEGPEIGGRFRIGLSVTQVPPKVRIPLQRRDLILEQPGAQRAWRRIQLAGAAVGSVPSRLGSRLGFRKGRAPVVDIVEYPNENGQVIRAIVNRTGAGIGGPAVVIPPAWGRTKETLAPLAATLIRTFERRGEPLTVVRFDGTQRRGESFVDPACRRPGDESINFTFSQAVRDVHATLKFLQEADAFGVSRVVLITFSLAAIDGRRAVATDSTGIVAGWVSVVGMVDVQSGLRAVSGGVDYVYGAQRGVEFGIHELGGVKVHIDRAARDVLDHHLGGFEDARRDMARIHVPVTWIHGRHDAWMDPEQVSELVSSGDSSQRKLIEVPTGHQLRSSWEALETFQLITEETSEMLLGHRLKSAVPNLVKLGAMQQAERARRPQPTVDLREFWRDYLVGRDGTLGIELLTATSGYCRFMERQIDLLQLTDGDSVLDLGCGTGDFSIHLAKRRDCPNVTITGVDYVADGLRRGRDRLGAVEHGDRAEVRLVMANLEIGQKRGIPFRPGSFDAALASLLVSYIEDPARLLGAVFSLLRPGGRLVVSAPRRDADLSRLYVDMMAELPPARVRQLFGAAAEEEFEAIQRHYLNEAARLLTLEDAGRFRFRDEAELAEVVRGVGFRDIETERGLGEPPQTVLVRARRP